MHGTKGVTNIMSDLHSYIFLNRTNHALDVLTKWYKKKPNNKELQELIKSVQYIIEHANMVERERQVYRDSFVNLERRCLHLQQELNDVWGVDNDTEKKFNKQYKK